jgi:hypothetical protein
MGESALLSIVHRTIHRMPHTPSVQAVLALGIARDIALQQYRLLALRALTAMLLAVRAMLALLTAMLLAVRAMRATGIARDVALDTSLSINANQQSQ